jgi:nucleotide-binding universal stress UspA family protein
MTDLLVPVDFSPTAGVALRYAARLAPRLNLQLRVLHVFDTLQDISHSVSDKARSNRRAQLEADLEAFTRTHAGQPAPVEVVEGDPAQTVLWRSTSEQTGLIVMGGVGAGAGAHPPGIFGGVARQVATRGGCPVMLLPKGY